MRYTIGTTEPVAELFNVLDPTVYEGRTVLCLNEYAYAYLNARQNELKLRKTIYGVRHDFWNNSLHGVDIVIDIPDYYHFEDFLAYADNGRTTFFMFTKLIGIFHKHIFPKFCTLDYRWFNIGNSAMWTDDYGRPIRLNSRWYTNLPYPDDVPKMELMTMYDNLNYNPQLKLDLRKSNWSDYPYYDDDDVLFVPRVDAIPSDYAGEMSVPITVFDKFCPRQFECLTSYAPHRKSNEGYRPYRGKLDGKLMGQKVLVRFALPLVGGD